MIRKFLDRDRRFRLSEEILLKVIKYPIVSEKSNLREGHYFFCIASWANKLHVASAVKMLFSVDVSSVNTLNCLGKTKRFRGRLGKRADYKKAIVCLKKGQTIDIANSGVGL